MRSITKIGLGFVLAGMILIAGWTVWLQTRDIVPVNIPLAMTIGHVRTAEFSVNVRSRYQIEIEVEKKIPFDTLNCLLGMAGATATPCPDAEVVNAGWKLFSGENIVREGSSADDRGGAWANDTISREIGEFEGSPGGHYRLEVDILTDGARLAAGNPRLKVSVSPDFLEGAGFLTALRIAPAAGMLLLIGFIVLTVSLLQNRRRRQHVTP